MLPFHGFNTILPLKKLHLNDYSQALQGRKTAIWQF
jgi:hypothetical protein